MLSIQHFSFHDQYYENVYENKSHQGSCDFFIFAPSPHDNFSITAWHTSKIGIKAYYNTLTYFWPIILFCTVWGLICECQKYFIL